MHPAWSIIFFTSASGLGLGLAGWIVLGLLDLTNFFHFIFVSGVTFGLISAGLLSSTLHLGHPERAWRALSQWRSSWLSREGVLAVFVLATLSTWFAIVFLVGTAPVWLGLALIVLIIATVFATAMIYASLKTVSCWHHPLTPACYLLFSDAGGMLAFMWVASILNQSVFDSSPYLASFLILIAWSVKFFWWQMLDTRSSSSTLETATGLGKLGKVRSLMPPHTSENYLQTEMGFVVARRHALKLRAISVLMGGIIPVLTLIALSTDPIFMTIALISHLCGIFVERWLFFAEAKHVVSIYYGEVH